MKKIILAMILLGTLVTARAQTLTHARFVLSPKAGSFSSIDLEINDEILVSISGSGKIMSVLQRLRCN